MEFIKETTTPQYLTHKTRLKFNTRNKPILIVVSVTLVLRSVILSLFKSLELNGFLCAILKLIIPHN